MDVFKINDDDDDDDSVQNDVQMTFSYSKQ